MAQVIFFFNWHLINFYQIWQQLDIALPKKAARNVQTHENQYRLNDAKRKILQKNVTF